MEEFRSNEGIRVRKKQPRARATAEKLYYSKYFVTISTNVRPLDAQDAVTLSEQLSDGIDNMMQTNTMDILRFPDPNFPPDASKIVDVKYQGMTEVGSSKRGGRVHWHGIIEVTHKSKLRIFKEDIKSTLKAVMGIPNRRIKNLYVSTSWIKSHKPIQNYVAKTVVAADNAAKLKEQKQGPKRTNVITAPQEVRDAIQDERDDDEDDRLGRILNRFNGLQIY